MELTLILFGISLIINIALGIFAIVYPVRVSNRDYGEIKKISSAILEVTKISERNINTIKDNIISSVNQVPNISDPTKKVVGSTVSNILDRELRKLGGFGGYTPEMGRAYQRRINNLKEKRKK